MGSDNSSPRLDPSEISSTTMLAAGVLILLVTLTFAYTVYMRLPWFGTLSVAKGNRLQWGSAITLRDAKAWYREGPWTLRFGSWREPNSIEFPTLKDRKLYASYPPGVTVPLYLTAVISGREPTAGMLMAYNWANHFLIALFMALTSFVFLRRIGLHPAGCTALSLIPSSIELLMPGPLYWQQSVFFVDEAVILPFVFVVFAEVVRDCYGRSGRWAMVLTAAQVLTICYGILTDWLFVFVLTVLYGKRLVMGQAGSDLRSIVTEGVKFWAPPVLALSLFALQMYILDGFDLLISRGLHRARSFNAEFTLPWNPSRKATFADLFWKLYIPLNFGRVAVPLLWFSLVGWLGLTAWAVVRKLRGTVLRSEAVVGLSLMALVLVPTFVQIYVLKQHSLCHPFSALKFCVPFSLVPFVVLPATISACFARTPSRWLAVGPEIPIPKVESKKRIPVLLVVLMALAAGLVAREFPRRVSLFAPMSPELDVMGSFIDKNTAYSDVVVSPHFEVKNRPVQWLSYTMKRVYKVSSFEEMCRLIQDIDGNYTIAVFVDESKGNRNHPAVQALIAEAVSVERKGPLRLYKIPRERFISVARCQRS